MKTCDFDYSLPPELIAQSPSEPRDSSRLLVLSRGSGAIQHRAFRDIVDYLSEGDLLVFNDTRVIGARLRGSRQSGGRVELLLLKKHSDSLWEALVKPGRVRDEESVLIVKPAPTIGSYDSTTCQPDATLELEARIGKPCGGGTRLVSFSRPELLDSFGEVPLPPYIRTPIADAGRYQTVYARVDGSAAAPTAGLHFTPELLGRLNRMGVRTACVTLHIGLDTFRPVRDEDPRHHQMHREHVEISSETCEIINSTKAARGRVVCVGTTSVRTLEAAARNGGSVSPLSGDVDLFILPGYRFRVTDAMVTNFHLPRTTLLMLVSAFAGRETALSAYREAIAQRYRFYSFGDAMLIL